MTENTKSPELVQFEERSVMNTQDTTGRLMRAGLSHSRISMADEEFLTLIDSTGGWPLGYKFVGFEHTSSRDAGFTNDPRNTGWWTVLCAADDYYLWKLSAECLQRVVDAVRASIRLSTVNASELYIKNSSGTRAVIAKAKERAS